MKSKKFKSLGQLLNLDVNESLMFKFRLFVEIKTPNLSVQIRRRQGAETVQERRGQGADKMQSKRRSSSERAHTYRQ